MTLRNMSSRHMRAHTMNTHVMSARSMSAHVVVRLVSLAAGLRATFRRSRMRLCRRAARHGLAAID
jgi:hypothetical protein